MLWIIPVVIASVLIFRELFYGTEPPGGFIDGMMLTFFWLFFTAIIAGICCGGAALTGLAFASHAVQVSDVALVAIRDKDGVEGRFFLGSGVIKSDQYYFYYARMADGGFRPGKIVAGSGVRVYEEKRQDARLVIFTWVVDNYWVNLIAIPVNQGGYSYDFHVPEGTIRTGYTM